MTKNTNNSVVQIVESSQFHKDSRKLLTPPELRGLHLIVADNPLIGTPMAGVSEVLEFSYARCLVRYVVHIGFDKVHFLTIEPEDDSEPITKEERSALKKALKIVSQTAFIFAAKKGVKWLIDLLKDDT